MEYCIYTDKYFEEVNMNVEHIIPKSLGGCNDFTIRVNKDINSKLGSEVDGKLINEFLMKFKQIHMQYNGHSNKQPVLKMKNSSIDGNPVSVSFSKDSIEVFDPVNKSFVNGKKTIQMNTTINLYSRLRFISKVALASGYFLFGDLFIKHADHNTLRTAMFSTNLEKENLDLRFYDNLHRIEERDKADVDFIKFFFSYLKGSVVLFSYSSESFIVHVGIGGEYLGMVNFKADIDKFPVKQDDYRLGHILLCKDGKLIRDSYWKNIYNLNKELRLVDIDDSMLDL